MTLSDNLKSILDRVRSIPARLDLRPYTVTVRLRSWSGTRPGLGTKTDTDTELLVDGYAPHVRQLSQRDVIASGGLYSTQDFEVTLTPSFTVGDVSGGVAVSSFEPSTTSHPQEIFFKLTGPGIPENGAWFKKVGQNISESVTLRITLKKTAEVL